MLRFSRSYIYENIINVSNNVGGRITKILTKPEYSMVLNNELQKSVNDMVRFYKDPISVAIQRAINDNRMILAVVKPEVKLAACIPFVKFKSSTGPEKVFVDLSNYVKVTQIGDITEYSIDIKKLYTICSAAIVTLNYLHDTLVVSSDIAKWSAFLWARMFCKVLNSAIGLSTDVDRYDAFMYFAMKFFCLHILELPVPMADKIAEGMTPNFKENYMLNNMLRVIEDKRLPIYENIATFCDTLFTDEVSNLKGIKIANVEDKMNVSDYFKRFMIMYGPASVMSLGAFPYFLCTIMGAYNQAMIVNDRSFKDFLRDDDKKAYNKLINAIYKEFS